MAPGKLFPFLMILLAIPGLAWADPDRLDLPVPSTLVLAREGHFVLEAQAGQEGLTYRIDAKDRKGKPASGLILTARPCKQGLLLRVEKRPGSRGYAGTPKVTLTLDPGHDVRFDGATGDYFISNLHGAISGTVQSGRINLQGCSGAVQLKVRQGSVTVADHLSSGQPFDLNMKQGNIMIELGKTPAPGPGNIRLESGRVTWGFKQPVPVRFHGEVEDGLITCPLPITRPDPKVIAFTSLGGNQSWKIHLKKGILHLQLPSPK